MTKYIVEASEPKSITRQPFLTSINSDKLSQLDGWRQELDSYYQDFMNLNNLPPQEVFEKISAYSARASYIRSQLCRTESKSWSNFRTKEVEHFLRECEFQFKVHSRNLSVKNLEWEVNRYDD